MGGDQFSTQLAYTPELDFIGSDSFGFSVSDGTNVSSETIVPIEVYMRYINNPVAMENSLLGKNSNDQFGKSVDFDANGVTMAVGAPFNDDSFNNAGQVVVYDYDNDQWTQKGSAINGLGENYYFGYNVKLSSDGTSLLVQEGEQGNCCSTSYISVYRFINDDWVKLGSTITKNDYYTMENIALSDDLWNQNPKLWHRIKCSFRQRTRTPSFSTKTPIHHRPHHLIHQMIPATLMYADWRPSRHPK